MSLAKLAHQYIQSVLQTGDNAIDATVGNGHDTLFLARQVGLTGRVYGFDIQTAALDSSREKLQQTELIERVTLIQASHADMAAHIPINAHGNIKACMFNLGYLPKGDKAIITQTASTLQALNTVCDLLAEQGIITIIIYSGHQGGKEEADSVEQWLSQLNTEQFKTSIELSAIPTQTAPKLFVIHKLVMSS
jgi:16S rRNA C1402 N4-methylase RsmH